MLRAVRAFPTAHLAKKADPRGKKETSSASRDDDEIGVSQVGIEGWIVHTAMTRIRHHIEVDEGALRVFLLVNASTCEKKVNIVAIT